MRRLSGWVRCGVAALPGKPNWAIERSGSTEFIRSTTLKNNGTSDGMRLARHGDASAEECEAGVVDGTKTYRGGRQPDHHS
jgi:hypothetical protein